MSQDNYRFIVSPENIKGDIFKVDYNGVEVGVYSAMTAVLTSGPNGSSSLTGLSVNVLLRQTAIDEGYYSPFDGAVLQKDVVSNFIFSSTTEDPFTYYIFNTSSQFQKFSELSVYQIDWGDNSPLQQIPPDTIDPIKHVYPKVNESYEISLKQKNPWGITKVTKKITVPYTVIVDVNPQGTAYFIPSGGAWSGTPISYDYIFSGDSENVVSAQTSNNFVSVPFPISGNTKSRLQELERYGSKSFQVGVPVIYNGQIWGAIDSIEEGVLTAYTINEVNYFDFENGITVFQELSSGFTENNLTAVPITKDEVLIKIIDQPQIQTNVFVERGKNSAYERIQRLGEVDNLGDLLNYGYGFFNVENKD